MPNEFGFDAALAIELLLKGEDHQHLANVLPHQLDARLPPCPQLRADVIDHRDSALVQLTREAKIEIRKVDQDSSVRVAAFCLGHHAAKALVDARQVLDDLGQSHHCDLVRVDHEFASGLLHPLAAHAEELQGELRRSPGAFLTKGLDQFGPVKFA